MNQAAEVLSLDLGAAPWLVSWCRASGVLAAAIGEPLTDADGRASARVALIHPDSPTHRTELRVPLAGKELTCSALMHSDAAHGGAVFACEAWAGHAYGNESAHPPPPPGPGPPSSCSLSPCATARPRR